MLELIFRKRIENFLNSQIIKHDDGISAAVMAVLVFVIGSIMGIILGYGSMSGIWGAEQSLADKSAEIIRRLW